MLPRNYEDQVCSIARALEVVGDRWTLLLLRDAFLGVRRFDDFQRSLGVSRHVLAERLDRLAEAGVLERRLYCERPKRFEYVLSSKGRELWPVLAHLMLWGDRHYLAEGGPPRIIEHRGCGGRLQGDLECVRCGERPRPDDLILRAGPGLPRGADRERSPNV